MTTNELINLLNLLPRVEDLTDEQLQIYHNSMNNELLDADMELSKRGLL